VRIDVLGEVRAYDGDGVELLLGPPRRQAVLTVLALRANHVVPRDEIVDAVWGDEPPASAAGNVYVYINALRQVLGPGVLVSDRAGYALRIAPGHLDVEEFEDRLRGARRLSGPDQLDRLDAALALWRGTPLAGVPGPYAAAQRHRLVELRLGAVEDRAQALLALGSTTDVVAELTALATEYPLRERLRGLLMRALHHTGRQAEALAVYADTRRMLVEELGIEPGAELQRVHQAVLTDRNVTAVRPDGTGPVPRQLPPPVRHFAGRAVELDTLARTGSGIVAINGMAGVGKTTLAIHWAHRAAEQFPDGQLYVNLRGYDPSGTAVPPTEALRGFLGALHVEPDRVPPDEEGQSGLYRSLLADKRVLVLLDNARDADQVRPLLPGTPGCLVLVTSRDQLSALVATEGAYPLPLDLLSEADSTALLAGHLGTERVTGDRSAVAEIVAHCAALPLALTIVAARAASHPRFPLAALAKELADTETGQLDDVRTAFFWSYRQLADPSARLFRLLGLHPGADVSAPGAASLLGVPVRDGRRTLDDLARAHLLTEHQPGRFTLHDLLRAYAAELAHELDPDGDQVAAQRRLLDYYASSGYAAARTHAPDRPPVTALAPAAGTVTERFDDAGQAEAWFATELTTLLAEIGYASRSGLDRHVLQFAWSAHRLLEYQGRWSEWVSVSQTALSAARRLGDRAAEGEASRSLAGAYARIGRLDEAFPYIQRALDIFVELGDRPAEVLTRINVAQLLSLQGKVEEALRHAERTLALSRESGFDVGQARALNMIAWWNLELGHHAAAVAPCEEALLLFRKLNNTDGESQTLDTLGLAHHHLGQYTEAAACYGLAMAMFREGGSGYLEAGSADRLGDTYLAMGDVASARRVWQQAADFLADCDAAYADKVRAKLSRLGTP
jgi:DNA-binding SARP family transcriptional activator/tetratricopeptide (TPR) repeat protein